MSIKHTDLTPIPPKIRSLPQLHTLTILTYRLLWRDSQEYLDFQEHITQAIKHGN